MAEKFSKILKIHPKDNIVVALRDLMKGDIIKLEDDEFKLFSNVAAKHKFSIENLNIGDSVYMYGVVVGKVKKVISKGEHISTKNIIHETADYVVSKSNNQDKWVRPNIEKFSNSTFLGYHRGDGTVGTENNWLVIPLVFCQNRNIETLQHGGKLDKIYFWGDLTDKLSSYVNSWEGEFPVDNTQADGFEKSAPVKTYPPNGYGLYEISGNVWEWTSDWYSSQYYKYCKENSITNNPKGPREAFNPSNPYVDERVIRGGSFLCNASYCASYRVS